MLILSLPTDDQLEPGIDPEKDVGQGTPAQPLHDPTT